MTSPDASGPAASTLNFCSFLSVCAMLRCCVVLSCFFWCFVTDVHGIGPTYLLLLLLCVSVSGRVLREREGER